MDAPLRNEAARGGHIQLSSTCLATNGKWHYKGGASPVCGQLRGQIRTHRGGDYSTCASARSIDRSAESGRDIGRTTHNTRSPRALITLASASTVSAAVTCTGLEWFTRRQNVIERAARGALALTTRLSIDGLGYRRLLYLCACRSEASRRIGGGCTSIVYYCAQAWAETGTQAWRRLDGPKACPLMDGGVVVADTQRTMQACVSSRSARGRRRDGVRSPIASP